MPRSSSAFNLEKLGGVFEQSGHVTGAVYFQKMNLSGGWIGVAVAERGIRSDQASFNFLQER